jgi:hypothetical protein
VFLKVANERVKNAPNYVFINTVQSTLKQAAVPSALVLLKAGKEKEKNVDASVRKNQKNAEDISPKIVLNNYSLFKLNEQRRISSKYKKVDYT